eukprot:g4725.t1
MQPVTTFAMCPTTGNKNVVEKAIKQNMGPFYGKDQADEWKKELYKKEYERQYALKTYDVERYPELYTDEERNEKSVRHVKLAEYERTVPGGYNELGPKDDKITLHASALSGSIHQHSPRFLQTLVGTPAHKANKFTKGTKDLLLLGLQPTEKAKPDLHSTDLGYDPLSHKYRGKPPNYTALQRRTTRERTGYVAIAGGKKGSSEFGEKESNMKKHMEMEYSRVPREVEVLQDESASLQNKLRMIKTKIGNGEKTKALMQFDQEPFPDKEKEGQQYLEKFNQLMSTYKIDREKQLSINRKIMETNYRLVDPFTEHPYGINYGRKGKAPKGYNPIMDRPNHLQEEYELQQKEKAEYLKRVEMGFQEQMKKESSWNLVTNCDKLTGVEHLTPHNAKVISLLERQRIDQATENSKELTKIIQHHHAPHFPASHYENQFPKVGRHSETADGRLLLTQKSKYRKELAEEYNKLLNFKTRNSNANIEPSSGDLIFGKINMKSSKNRKPETVVPSKPSIFDPMLDPKLKYPQKRAAPFRHKYYMEGQKNPKMYIEYDSVQKVGGLLGDRPKEFILPTPPRKRPLCAKVTPVKHRKECKVKSPPNADSNLNISKFGVIVPSTRIEYDRRHLYNKFGDLGRGTSDFRFCV